MQYEAAPFPPERPALAVALDLPDPEPALALAGRLSGLPVWLKVGLELFSVGGPDLVRRLLDMRFAMFLDLKYHDIPNTVRGAVLAAARLGAHMLTLHIEGGEAMCRAAVEAKDMAERATPPLLMGVTVLTSRDGEADAVRALVVERARRAKAWGLDGVVCSGHEAGAVKAACGPDFLVLCPGIRPKAAATDDQARVMTPDEAVRAGADFLVMGRPITRAGNPAEAALDTLSAMRRTR